MKLSLSAFFQCGLNVQLIRRLPASFCYGYIQLLGKIFYLFRPKERRIIGRNIRDLMGDRDEAYIRQVIRETFKGIFAHYFEKLFSAFRDVEQIRSLVQRNVTIQNVELLDRALRGGKGVMMVTAHFGAVEFIPWVLGFAGYPVSAVLECTTEALHAALMEKTRYIDCELITGTDGSSVFFKALQSLKANRLLMTECDEVDTWHKRKNRTIDLFGQTLYLDNTLNVLARRSGAPTVGVFLKRVSRSRYTLICEPIETNVDTAIGALELFEKHVGENPEQWYQWKKWSQMKVAS